jgi:hypothetical protein
MKRTTRKNAGALRAEVKAPVGSVSVEPVSSDDPEAHLVHLQRVVAHVERSAQWFEAEELTPGEWIYFEDRLNYSVFGWSDESAVLLFFNVNREVNEQTRLLLHGSPEHLLSGVKVETWLRREWVSPAMATCSWIWSISYQAWWRTSTQGWASDLQTNTESAAQESALPGLWKDRSRTSCINTTNAAALRLLLGWPVTLASRRSSVLGLV